MCSILCTCMPSWRLIRRAAGLGLSPGSGGIAAARCAAAGARQRAPCGEPEHCWCVCCHRTPRVHGHLSHSCAVCTPTAASARVLVCVQAAAHALAGDARGWGVWPARRSTVAACMRMRSSAADATMQALHCGTQWQGASVARGDGGRALSEARLVLGRLPPAVPAPLTCPRCGADTRHAFKCEVSNGP